MWRLVGRPDSAHPEVDLPVAPGVGAEVQGPDAVKYTVRGVLYDYRDGFDHPPVVIASCYPRVANRSARML